MCLANVYGISSGPVPLLSASVFPTSSAVMASLPVQVIESWDPAVWARSLAVVEKGICGAAQDAQAETRTYGRAAYAAYASVAPDKARAFCGRMDSDLQAKFTQAAAQYQRGALLNNVHGASSNSAAVGSYFAAAAPLPAAPAPRASRKSVGGGLAPSRPATATASFGGAADEGPSPQRSTATRTAVASAPGHGSGQSSSTSTVARVEASAGREGVSRSRKSMAFAPERVLNGGLLMDSTGEGQVT